MATWTSFYIQYDDLTAIEQELKELQSEKADLDGLLQSDSTLRKRIIKEIESDAKEFGDERRTLIQEDKRAIAEAKVIDEPVTVIVSQKGWVRVRQGHEHDAQQFSFKSGDALYATYECRTVDVMQGFGNNGGEEFLSYLQTGEGMIMGKDKEWKKWYDNMNGRLLKIQNQDGSWNGHHCITSPVFCTATCLLILSVNNDIEQLVAMGK